MGDTSSGPFGLGRFRDRGKSPTPRRKTLEVEGDEVQIPLETVQDPSEFYLVPALSVDDTQFHPLARLPSQGKFLFNCLTVPLFSYNNGP